MEKIKELLLLAKNNQLEVIFLSVSIMLGIISLVAFFTNKPQLMQKTDTYTQNVRPQENISKEKIMVDIEGSIKHPDMYELNSGARLKDILTAAGGLTDDADKLFFSRNFNLAQTLSDEEKLYIPNSIETSANIFPDNTQIIQGSSTDVQQSINKVSVNSASLSELNNLPGIGLTIAQKIVDSRPFSSLDDLVNQKIMNKGLFDKLSSRLTLN